MDVGKELGKGFGEESPVAFSGEYDRLRLPLPGTLIDLDGAGSLFQPGPAANGNIALNAPMR